MNIMHKLAEDAIGTILAGSDDWIHDDQYHEFEGDYDWSDDDICTLYFRVDGKYIGSWDVDIAEIEDINTLDNISAEVEAAVSGMDVLKENWQDDWVEPTIDRDPIDNINGLDIYKGTDQYGDEAYYLFLEDEDPEPGYEEWQTETLELAREGASSYEDPNDFVEADDFDEIVYESFPTSDNISIIKESYSKYIPNEILDMIKNSSRVRDAFIKIGLDPSKMIIDKVDKFHKHNPNYIPIEIYDYDLKDGYSSSAYIHHGGTGISIGNIDINRNTGHYFTPGMYVSKTSVIGMYEIDITKNIENDAIIGDKIELRAINKNDPKNQYLDRTKPDDDLTDKSGYYTVGNFKSKYGKKELTRRHDIMKAESVEADDFDDEVEPNAYNYIFKALDKSYWDGFDWSDVEYYDNKPCKVIDTSVVLHDFKSSYHDIEFKDGTVLSAISGMHLLPVNKGHNPHFTESIARKVEGETKMFVKKGSIIHNAGETLEVLDQNSDDTLLVGLNNDGDRKNRYIVAWGLQSDGSWNQGHYFFDEKEARKSFDERAKIRTESNSVSRNIPFTLDNFLQDVAQITGTISYLDIANFKYTEKDKASLNKLRSAWYDALDNDADDEVLQDIGRKIANYIKK